MNKDANVKGIILQHEYGIFGGIEGKKILSFMEVCRKPILTTLHTVLPEPGNEMREITKEIIRYSCIVVVLTSKSKKIIEELYPSARGKVSVIPHGIHPTTFAPPEKYKAKLELENKHTLSTFGLLSRGKGIEYIIRALPPVIKKYPSLIYLVLGETHPVIQRSEGESYRKELIRLVNKLGLKKHVKFYNQYLSLHNLFTYLKATDIYISSSTNPNQAVSGTLSYALGSGCAVVSTQFTQSSELVTPDVGRLVPTKDSKAITKALLDLLSDKARLESMRVKAYEKTRPMLWSTVAEKYIKRLSYSIIPNLNLDHLKNMTDDFGLFQFAIFSTPNKDFGYALDDNARALIICSWLIKQYKLKDVLSLMQIYFTFIQKCQQENGLFINYIGADKAPTKQNKVEDLEDAQARTLWALTEVMTNIALPIEMRNKAKEMFLVSYPKCFEFTHLRAVAFAIKAFTLIAEAFPEYKSELTQVIHKYAQLLLVALKKNSKKSWMWFEKHLVYGNGILPESLLIAGEFTQNKEYIEKGILSLKFLTSKTFSPRMYRPIGHSDWYKNNERRSSYDQQPEDPASMISVLYYAYKITGEKNYIQLAKKCFSWFLGNNTLKKPLYNEETGGCFDGLHPDRVNLNQGAESLISYLMARYYIKELS